MWMVFVVIIVVVTLETIAYTFPGRKQHPDHNGHHDGQKSPYNQRVTYGHLRPLAFASLR